MLFEKLITIVPLDRINPEPVEITEAIAAATLGSFQALWHPAILNRSATIPVWVLAKDLPVAAPRQLILVPEPSRPLLPVAWEDQAASAGATVVAGATTRSQLLLRLFERLPEEVGRVAGQVEPDGFFAIALARLYLEMLTAYMHHVDTLDAEHLQKEVLAAAAAAVVGDLTTRDDHLRATFQVITEARERLYGADIYLLDLCLLDPSAGIDRLATQLDSAQPVNILASGRTVEELHARDVKAGEHLRKLLDESKVDLIGGEYEEVASTLLPLESHLWQFDRGAKAYRTVLGRAPVIFGRRRFGLARHVLQLLNRLEFLYLTHFCFDDGVFPVKSDPKVRWEAPDSSTVEALTRIPFAADNAVEFLRFPGRLARTIASDFVATLTLAHWPMPDAPWYGDMLTMSRFANVFGKFATLSHYFQATDPPAISSAVSSDDYATPFLEDDHRHGSMWPVSEYPRHHRARARLEQLRWMMAVAQLLGGASDCDEQIDNLESCTEQHDPQISDRVQSAERESMERLADLVCPGNIEGEPGILLFNLLNFDRRVVVPVQGYAAEERSSVELQAAAPVSPWASLTIPSMGFAWVKNEVPTGAGDGRTNAVVEDRTIRNEFLEVEIEPTTGGIRSVRDRTNRLAQLAQQLVMVGISPGRDDSAGRASDLNPSAATDAAGEPIRSEMRFMSLSVESSGPELASLTVDGELVANRCPAWADDPVLARFRQRYRLGRGETVLRVAVELLEMKPAALHARVSPWQSYVASRFAWSDPRSMLVRGIGTLTETTRSLRPESPYFVEVHGRRNRVAILTGGLPFHQRVGTRMLDTLLVTATEQCRQFEFGIGIDLPNPFQAALDLVTPLVMIGRRGPPANGPAGWFFHLDARNIVVTSTAALARGRFGVQVRLFESAGRYTRARLRCPRNVAEARLTDFRGQRLATLDVHGDTVILDLAPREITQLEIEFAVA